MFAGVAVDATSVRRPSASWLATDCSPASARARFLVWSKRAEVRRFDVFGPITAACVNSSCVARGEAIRGIQMKTACPAGPYRPDKPVGP